MSKQREWITATLMLVCIVCAMPGVLSAQELQTENSVLVSRVAPGEALPLAVRFSNFGNNNRVDVSVWYEIFDSKESLVFSQTETVAVETSASYIKQIPLPGTAAPGLYTARTSIMYQGQKAPAVASQQFTVERKVYGIFVSDLIIDTIILCAVALLCILLGLVLRRYHRESLLVPHDYSGISKDVRIYYEILGDAIQQMRYHEGDKALEVAANIPGLALDGTNGKVLAITRIPSEVIADVVSEYEKAFGKKLNLTFGDKGRGHAIVR